MLTVRCLPTRDPPSYEGLDLPCILETKTGLEKALKDVLEVSGRILVNSYVNTADLEKDLEDIIFAKMECDQLYI